MTNITTHHGWKMVLCCVVPLGILLAAVYFFGLSKSYLFWFVLLLCPLMHYFMMRDMHGEHKGHHQHKEVMLSEPTLTKSRKSFKGLVILTISTLLLIIMLVIVHPGLF